MRVPLGGLAVRVGNEIVDGPYARGDGVPVEGALNRGQAAEGQEIRERVHAYVGVKEDVQILCRDDPSCDEQRFGQQGDAVRMFLDERGYLIFLMGKQEQVHFERIPVEMGDEAPHVLSYGMVPQVFGEKAYPYPPCALRLPPAFAKGGDKGETRTDAFVEPGELRLNVPVVEPLIGEKEIGLSYVAERVVDG